MKNVAIFGASRSGKSTFSKMIAKKYTNYHIIVGDDIRSTFSNVLPENNINSVGGSGMKGDFQKFISCLFYKNIKRNQDCFNYIIETCDMEPDQAKTLFNNKNTVVLFFGFPNQTVQDHIDDIKKYQTEIDWTYDRTYEDLLKHSNYWTTKSKEFEKECKELDIWFVDTSMNREEVLEKTFQILEKSIID